MGVESAGNAPLPPLQSSGIASVERFSPLMDPALGAWLRLDASTPSGGEWDTVVDAKSSNPAVQPSANRKPAAALSNNGLPVMVYDGSDMLTWPLTAANSAVDRWGIALWIKFASVGATQHIHNVMSPGASGGANLTRAIFNVLNTGGIAFNVFTLNFNGRGFNSANGIITTGVWYFCRVQYDRFQPNEFDSTGSVTDAKVRIYLNESAIALNGINQGSGGTIGALTNATGSAYIGAANNSDTPVAALQNGTQMGDVYVFNDNLTPERAQAFFRYRVPT